MNATNPDHSSATVTAKIAVKPHAAALAGKPGAQPVQVALNDAEADQADGKGQAQAKGGQAADGNTQAAEPQVVSSSTSLAQMTALYEGDATATGGLNGAATSAFTSGSASVSSSFSSGVLAGPQSGGDAAHSTADAFGGFNSMAAQSALMAQLQAHNQVQPVAAVVDHAPEGTAGSASTTSGVAVSGQVIASDVDGDHLTFAVRTAASHGTVSMGQDGHYSYTSAGGFVGSDSFVVQVSDGRGGITLVSETMTVSAAPVVNHDPILTTTSISGHGEIDGTLTATDSDGDAVTFAIAALGGAAHGVVSLGSDGSYRYTPDADWHGSDAFTVQVSDGRGGVSSHVVTVASNDAAPVVTGGDITGSGNIGHAIYGALTLTDADGDGMSYVVSSDAGHGVAVVDASGNWAYEADGYVGHDQFTVTVSDGHGGTVDQVIGVDVGDPGASHSAIGAQNATAGTAFELDTSSHFTAPVNGDTLTFSASGLAAGLIIDATTGIISGTPTGAESDSVTVTATDAYGVAVHEVFGLTVGAGVNPHDVHGTSADDILTGTSGNDFLTGNGGADQLTGNGGHDVFAFNPGDSGVATFATITDFAAGDQINLVGGSVYHDYGDFSWVSSDPATFHDTIVSWNVSGLFQFADATTGNKAVMFVGDGDSSGRSFDGTLIEFSNGTVATGTDVVAQAADYVISPLQFDAALPATKTAIVGSENTWVLPTATDSNGGTVHYTVTQADGSPLPSWLHFDAVTNTVTADATQNGSVSLRYTATDGGDVATGTFTVNAVSVERIDTFDVMHNGNPADWAAPYATSWFSNGDHFRWQDPNGNWTGTVLAGGEHSNVTIAGWGGGFNATPHDHSVTSDSFVVDINDGVSDHIIKANINFVADAAPTVTGLTHDHIYTADAEGDVLSTTIAQQAVHGTITVQDSGVGWHPYTSFSWDPSGYVGNDTFQVQISDGWGGTVSQTVNVTSTDGATYTVTNADQWLDAFANHSSSMGAISGSVTGDGDTWASISDIANGTDINLGTGLHVLSLQNDGGIVADLGAGTISGHINGHPFSATLEHVDGLVGGNASSVITGGLAHDYLAGIGTLIGGAGADTFGAGDGAIVENFDASQGDKIELIGGSGGYTPIFDSISGTNANDVTIHWHFQGTTPPGASFTLHNANFDGILSSAATPVTQAQLNQVMHDLQTSGAMTGGHV
jgi:large repetitive protein